MTNVATVCLLSSLTVVFLLLQWPNEANPDEWNAFSDEEVEHSFSWMSMLRRILLLLLTVIGGPLALMVLQQRQILYRPEVARMRVSRGQKSKPMSWGLEHEEFFLSSRDGTKLHTWLLYSQREAKAPRPAVLFFHSNAGDIPQRLDFFSRLCRHLDVVILAMEYRGFGRSDDAEMSEESFVEDAACAYQWLVNYASRETSGVDPQQLYLFGRSLGGCVAVRLVTHLLGMDPAARSPPQPLELSKARLPLPAGILIENSPSSIADVATHLMPFLKCLPKRILAWPVLLDEWRSNDWLDWIGQTLSKEQRSLRLCLLSAVHDKVVPVSCMEELFRVGQKHQSLDVSFHSFQRGEHMSTYLLAGERYWQALRIFLQRE